MPHGRAAWEGPFGPPRGAEARGSGPSGPTSEGEQLQHPPLRPGSGVWGPPSARAMPCVGDQGPSRTMSLCPPGLFILPQAGLLWKPPRAHLQPPALLGRVDVGRRAQTASFWEMWPATPVRTPVI